MAVKKSRKFPGFERQCICSNSKGIATVLTSYVKGVPFLLKRV